MAEKEILIPSEYAPLLEGWWREAAVHGGRYSLKSHTVARILLIRAMRDKIRVGCFREFQNSIADSSHQLLSDIIKQYDLSIYRVTENSIINTLNGSDFLFRGLHHNMQNIKSLEGIDIGWVEEAQTISEGSLEILTPTIRKPGSQIIYTYNRLFEEDPVHKRLVMEGRPNTLVINENYDIAIKYGWMPEAVLNEINDDKKHRPKLYKHKWLGEPDTMESRIYNNWVFIDSIPEQARLERRGLDFGYSLDPTAIVDIYYLDGGFILDERIYRKNMSNKDIADWLTSFDESKVNIYADSAEPKSIDEISMYGVNIIPAQKGPGSVLQGIQYVQDQRISVTKRSTNLIREYHNYLWEKDKNDEYTGKPLDLNNHCMDAIRYALESYSRNYSRDTGIITIQPAHEQAKSWAQEDENGVPIGYAINIERAVKQSAHEDKDWMHR